MAELTVLTRALDTATRDRQYALIRTLYNEHGLTITHIARLANTSRSHIHRVLAR